MEHEILLFKFYLFTTATPINLNFLFLFDFIFFCHFNFLQLSSLFHFLSLPRFSYAPLRSLLLLVCFLFPPFASTSFLRFPSPCPTPPRDSPRLSSVIPSLFLVPPLSPLSFPPPPSLSFSLSDPFLPLPPPHFIENVWYAGAFYTGTEPPSPLSGLMAGKEQPGRLLVRTFVSRRRGHAEMWPSTCSQGFEARAHARTWALSRRKRIKCSHGDYRQGWLIFEIR